MAFTSSRLRADIKGAAISKWWVKVTDATPDAGFYSLGKLYEGKISVKTPSQKDTLGMNQGVAAELVASAKMFSTGKTSVLKSLDALGTRELDHAIITVGNGTITSHGLAQPTFGMKWKFICDKDSNSNRYIEVEASRAIDRTELTVLLTTVTPTLTGATGTDVLAGLGTISSADVIAAGFSKFEICNTYNGTFQDVGHIQNGKLIVELVCAKDSFGQDKGFNMKVDFEVDAMQSSATELAQLQALQYQDCFYKITLLDGTVVTLGSASVTPQAGNEFEVTIEGDSEKIGLIKIIGTGIIQSASLDGIFV